MSSTVNLRDQVTRLGLLLSLAFFAAVAMVGQLDELVRPWPQATLARSIPPPVDVDAPRKEAITEYLAAKYKKEPETVRTYVETAFVESSKHPDVTPELILAVIQKESSLNEDAVSGYGAQGLMQVVPRFHGEKLQAKESLYDAQVNIRVGAEVLQEYLSRTRGDLRRALRRYSGDARGYYDFVVNESTKLKDI